MPTSNPKVGDVGTAVRFKVVRVDPLTREYLTDENGDYVPEDLSAATGLAVNVLRADGTRFTREGDLVTDGTDGLVQFVTEADELTVAGRYRAGVTVTEPGGAWGTDDFVFKVEARV
jgi:hypothetical protein